MRTWLARLTFPFFVLAFVLAWEAYKLTSAGGPAGGRATLYVVAAAMSFALGMRGVRERHRPG